MADWRQQRSERRTPETKRKMRRVFGVLAVIAGSGLIFLEFWRSGWSPASAEWVWILIATVLLMLGLAELFGPRDAPPERLGE